MSIQFLIMKTQDNVSGKFIVDVFRKLFKIRCKCFLWIRYHPLNRDIAKNDANHRQFKRLTDSSLLPLVWLSSNFNILIGNSSLEKNEHICNLDLSFITGCSSSLILF